MLRFKKLITASFFIIPLIISTNSHAFNIPKELASLGVQSLSQHDIFSEKADYIKPKTNYESNNVRKAILAQFANWKGTQYHFGGTTHKGVDCSALMQHIFSDSFHKELPRTTGQQIQNGSQVSKDKLQPGDLVFFKTSPGMRHVGVYVGDNQFIHASSTQGVTISSLANNYWVEHYETARHLEVVS
ncbi:glycoside hydrolase [Buttiauxella sp. B2]|uniref:NlpC/P60 family protein n=1 Tax=Buttiauxella sp. B2 TaxID=2587812 RepID=UPI00111D2900|nr:NlpC/P60 family protein [Buttiauxella sp. B2]TNV18855.1 glycoside hydrolase [Buttiauxella sp. B2]